MDEDGVKIENDSSDDIPTKSSKCEPPVVKLSTRIISGPDVYTMTAAKKGFCVIVDESKFDGISAREGSTTDAIRLHSVFSQIGFHVIHVRNKSVKQINNVLDNIVRNPDMESHNALVVIILSHGGKDGVICCRDYKFDVERNLVAGYIRDQDIVNKFNDKSCPALKNKPKIFLFSCCRGSKYDKVEVDNASRDVNYLSDIFVGYGTREECYGFRRGDLGTFFGISIAEVLGKNAHAMEWSEIFEEITKRCKEISTHTPEGKTERTYQNPESKTYKWKKKLYFNPGVHETMNTSIENRSEDNTTEKKIELESVGEEEFAKHLEICFSIKILNDERLVQYYFIRVDKEHLTGGKLPNNDSWKSFKCKALTIQMEKCDKNLKDIMVEIVNDSNLMTVEAKRKELTPLGYYIASQLFIESLEGVDCLHEQNPPIIHRGINPENIMLKIGSNNRFVKIGDFAIATVHLYDEQSHTKGKGGHSHYVAPEVRNGTNYGTKADIYSLGFVLQELFYIDVNRDYTKNDSSAFMKKYQKLNELYCKMASLKVVERPSCKEILANKREWALSAEELDARSELKKVANSEKKSFVYSMIKLKLNAFLSNTLK